MRGARDGRVEHGGGARELHAAGVKPGPVATYEDLVCHPEWREAIIETTSVDLAIVTVAILSGLAEFFDAEARAIAS